MKKRKLAALFMACAIAVSVFAGCGSSKSVSGSSQKKDVTLGLAQLAFYNVWDPHTDWNGWYSVRYGVTETLFKLSENLEITPWLAEGYKNIDNSTWKITLKKDVKFSNGNEVTPEMVVRNFKRVAEKNDRAVSLKGATYEISGNDITIKTAKPYATFINDLTDPYASIIDLDAKEDVTVNPIGTGPLKIVELVKDKQISLTKNANYWDGTVKIDNLLIKIIPDMDTLLMSLQSGEVDIAYDLSKAAVETLKSDSNFEIKTTENVRPYIVYMNNTTLTDANVRKAVAMAVDKKSICSNLLGTSTTYGEGPFSDKLPYGSSKLNAAGYDQNGAKAALAAAGYTDTDSDGYVDKNGKKLTIRLMLYSRLQQETIATEMQAELKSAGIDCQVKVNDNRNYLKAGDFDLGMYTVATAPTGDSEAFFKGYVATGAPYNYGKYSNKEADKLIASLQTEFSPDKRTETAIKIQQMMLDDSGYMFMGMVNMSMVQKKTLTGFVNSTCEYYYVTKDVDVK
ncbi:MAG: ABC transporter substrate-binding protein [Clostridiaceae bacterium]